MEVGKGRERGTSVTVLTIKKGKNWYFPNVGQTEATPWKGGLCLAESGVFQQPWPLTPLPPLFRSCLPVLCRWLRGSCLLSAYLA